LENLAKKVSYVLHLTDMFTKYKSLLDTLANRQFLGVIHYNYIAY